MKPVDFYKLPRSIQDRFVGSVMSGFPPAPIVAVRQGTKTKLFWLGGSFASFVALVVVARLGYGSLESALSLHSFKALPLYAGLVFGLVFGLVQAFATFVREKALPYAAGVYLFPACVIDARSDQFKVYDTKDIAAVDLAGSAIRVAFSGGAQFFFPTDPANARALVAEISAARDRALHARATEEQKELVAVDPLHNPRFSSPVGPRDSYTMALPPWGRFGWAVALGLGLVLGPSLWALRNNRSDRRMYAISTQKDDAPSYRAYLAQGGSRNEEVGGILLPRAELREAIAARSVDALLEYKAKHPKSKIEPEVSAAIRAAMLTELEKAKAEGNLGAIQAFAKRYPEHGIERELRAATHDVYTRELDAYRRTRAPAKDKSAVAFVERLFAWAERHGPTVEVRFRRKIAASLERADQAILKAPNFMGVATYPSKFFDDKHYAPREAAVGKHIAAQLDAGISPELFDFRVGEAVPSSVDALPEVTVPTLWITHVTEWSGHVQNLNKPRGSFAGLAFAFDVQFVIPGDANRYKTTAQIFKPHASVSVIKEADPQPPPGQAEQMVYDAMATDALEQMAKRLLGGFVKPTE